jgi:hypothetical protein
MELSCSKITKKNMRCVSLSIVRHDIQILTLKAKFVYVTGWLRWFPCRTYSGSVVRF